MSDCLENHLTTPALEQVIEAYLLRRDEATSEARRDELEAARRARDVLAEFMRSYPQFAVELMDTAATTSIIENSPATASDAEQENLIVQRGMETAARLLAARRSTMNLSGQVAPLASLRKEAEARGLTIQSLAAATDLTVPLIVKLDRRLIRFASIPRQAIERIAGALHRTTEGIAAYLSAGDPQFAAGAHFLAETAPQMPVQQDFFDAVETDLNLSDEQKRVWREVKNERMNDAL
ncbi:MAG: hypothetical protein ACR2LC_04175 [Pyrinomonadaceae bacterium]